MGAPSTVLRSEEKPPQGTQEFTPPDWSLDEVRKAIPAYLFERSTARAMLYLMRDVAMCLGIAYLASYIEPTALQLQSAGVFSPIMANMFKWALWGAYWWFQSLIFTGLWVIAHECGHRGFSPNGLLCDVIGFILHSLTLTPYWSWKISHHLHHMSHGSMERDELWLPATRAELNLPPEDEAHEGVYEEYFGDSPIYNFFKLLSFHFFAFQAYLVLNLSGRKDYPAGTSHYNPYSALFRPTQRNLVILSDLGVLSTLVLLSTLPAHVALKYFWAPWFGLSHWIIFMTFLHHTDPAAPHYRGKSWTFTRGAAATVDRNFLGWQGRFFMHDISHFHVVHHYFPKLPFYNTEEATRHLKMFMGEQYLHSDSSVFVDFWRTWNECRFVEDTGSVLFYRNKSGKYARKDVA